MKKLLWMQIAIINMAILWIFTPNVLADDFTMTITKDSGIALIAQGKGEFTCGNGNQIGNLEIFVLLSETTRMGLGTSPSGLGLKSVETNENLAVMLNRGDVDSNNFGVEGILQVDDLCDLDSSTIFTANGACGSDKIITVKGSDGSFGTFQSNVVCSPLG